jgi:uncharacterized protein with NRDE domain
MCTLIAFHRPDPDVRLVIAANRDEYLDRPAAGPSLGRAGDVRVLAPRDLRAGGTWLGVSERGVFAALTNRPCPALDPGRRSRGLLVLDALVAPDAASAAERLGALAPALYNPFHLFVADGERAFVCVYEEGPTVTELAPGAHVIGNANPDDRAVPKVARLLDAAERIEAAPPEGWMPGLAAVCRDHEAKGGPFAPTCIHHGGYGTRSSTLLRLSADPRASELHFAGGPPCTHPYEDHSPLLRGLLRDARPAVGSVTARSLA